ncbi:hypothetical protein H632_c2487p0 [Helicosporidium sp. ATCC 50920]|nr:hypothetical protein H632_c2487p0 [Helicosporidium sp. ATCC 50920]|eukprot:KDD73144.1 hypothetical protein H632_c2487p0 [Helicosporidium sp. ATCC 50920]
MKLLLRSTRAFTHPHINKLTFHNNIESIADACWTPWCSDRKRLVNQRATPSKAAHWGREGNRNMSAGRVYALNISTKGKGEVVYERFYDNFSESDKAEIREAFAQTSSMGTLPGGSEGVGRYKNGRIVSVDSGDLTFYAVGTGEYNEIALSEILRAVITLLMDMFKVAVLSDGVIFSRYVQTALILDEVLKEGIVQHLDSQSVSRALALKLASTEASAAGSITTRLPAALKGAAKSAAAAATAQWDKATARQQA